MKDSRGQTFERMWNASASLRPRETKLQLWIPLATKSVITFCGIASHFHTN